jgi:hypothetical protein
MEYIEWVLLRFASINAPGRCFAVSTQYKIIRARVHHLSKLGLKQVQMPSDSALSEHAPGSGGARSKVDKTACTNIRSTYAAVAPLRPSQRERPFAWGRQVDPF